MTDQRQALRGFI